MVRGHVRRLLREHTEEKVKVVVWEGGSLKKASIGNGTKIDLNDKEKLGRYVAGAFVFMCMCVSRKWGFHRKCARQRKPQLKQKC